jgi:1-acyl-sn-glycerol-3-phosphate acyltransferase
MRNSAEARTVAIQPGSAWYAKGIDLLVTLILWAYFTIGFAALFGPFYLLAVVAAADRQRAFQKLNYLFFRSFFRLCRFLTPMQDWRIDPAVRKIRSSVIVCNHISYIDSILLVSLFARHTTIVKNRLFRFPILNRVMALAGYLPAASEGPQAALMVEQMEALPAFLASGGNLIVFPEGTRSRNGSVGPFNTGAFKIAKMCRAPVAVLKVRNTDRLFRPDRFRFNTCEANTIMVDLLARLSPGYGGDRFSIKPLMDQVRALYQEDERTAC